MALLFSACSKPAPTQVTVTRSGCVDCHRPLDGQGMAHGIEAMHPPVEGKPLTCVRCHGGDATARSLSAAHVAPAVDDPIDLRTLTHGELDTVSKAYLRFINPGDLRVADQACGEGCHQETVDAVKSSSMAIKSSSFAAGRYRAGQQRSAKALKAIRDTTNPRFAVGERAGTVGAVAKLDEPRINGEEERLGPYYDLMLSKECSGCHLYRFADQQVEGAHRSSGCSACHVAYDDSGLSQSADPTRQAGRAGRPAKHQMVGKPDNSMCTTCHQAGGGRIGLSAQGMRQAASPGHEPGGKVYVEGNRWGLSGRLIERESSDAHYDATPADVHFEAGMHCIDCHTASEVHGDGHLYSGGGAALEVQCETCHGTADAVADFTTRRGTVLEHLRRGDDGQVTLTSKVTGKEHIVPQVMAQLSEAPVGSLIHRSMGRNEDGFSHLDRLDCSACHSAWVPTCYGCHVEVDMGQNQTSQVTGNATLGRVESLGELVRTDELILALDARDRIKPSMPADRIFLSARNGAGEVMVDKQPRRTVHDAPGHGHRAIDPHTTRRWSPFMNCRRCHEGASARVAAGLGSNRYVTTDGNGVAHRLDQVQTEQGESVVTFGPRLDVRAAPLPLDVVDRLLNGAVDLPACDADASTAIPFSLLRDRWLEPSCGACHDGVAQPVLDHDVITAQTEGTTLEQSALWVLLGRGHQGVEFGVCEQQSLQGWYAGGRRND